MSKQPMASLTRALLPWGVEGWGDVIELGNNSIANTESFMSLWGASPANFLTFWMAKGPWARQAENSFSALNG